MKGQIREFRLADRGVFPLQGQISGPLGTKHVTPKAMDVLLFLAEHPGDVLSREEIRQHVWEAGEGTDEALRHSVSELRKALGDQKDNPHFIQTIPKRGYRLVAPVLRDTSTMATSPKRVEAREIPHTGDTPGKAALIWHELKRRKVIRVAVGYPPVAWLLVQMADIVLEHILVDATGWIMVGLITLLALGYPVAIFVAWAYEITESGIVRDTALPAPVSELLRSGRAADFLVIALLAVLVVTLAVFIATPPAPPPIDAQTIAVLPFEAASPEGSDEWLGRGLADHMINLLARLEEIAVASRTSSFRPDLQELDVREIGRRLAVRHVLEGSVSKAEGNLYVSARLIDTETGFDIWAEAYARTAGDLFAIQQEIAEQVVKALQLALPVKFRAELAKRPTDDIEAYDYYLQARSFLQKAATESSLKDAKQFFERALEHDPEFAGAYAGLCDAQLRLFQLKRSPQLIETAEQSCMQAVQLDADSVDAHVGLGNLYRMTADFEKAIAEFDNAIRLDTNASDAYLGLAEVHAAKQDDRAAEQAFQKAIKAKPDYWIAHNAFGAFLFAHGHFEEAIDANLRVVQLDPDNVTGYNNLGAAYFMKGEFERAADAYREVIRRAPTRSAYSNIGSSYYYLGRYDDAAIMYREAIALASQDHRLWGNLGDALTQLPERRPLAEQAYREAVRLAEHEMEVNPTNGVSLAALAYYRACLGEDERALENITRAGRMAPDDVYLYYYAALVNARLGREDAALVALERAIASGYPADLLKADPLFHNLRGRPDLAAMLDRQPGL